VSNLFLTIRQADVPKPQMLFSEESEPSSQDEYSEVFFQTPEHYKEFRAGLLKLAAQSESTEIPAYTDVCSQVAIDRIKESNMDWTSLDYLYYCHETIEKKYVLPALKIKRLFEMNACTPLMVSQSGSLSSLGALSLAQAAVRNEPDKLSLMVVADRVEFAALRYQFTGYLRGDCTSLIELSSSAGDYRIVEVKRTTDGIESSYPFWTEDDYHLAEQLMIDHAERLLQLARSTHGIDYVICHRLSDAFCRAVETRCRQLSAEFFTRRQWTDVNLLSSDPYVSLRRLEQEREVPPGSKLLLLFAGIDFGVGYLVLQK